MVMAKSPVAGRVKTRLCPTFSLEEAASVASASLADTLQSVARCGAERKIVALEGEPGPWLPPGFEIIPQRGEGLASRLTNAWADTGGGGLQVGMDTPQVGAAELDGLLESLIAAGERASVLGHAVDGGWWVIGLSDVLNPRDVFMGVPMSTPATGACQERRLRSLGLNVIPASVHRDIDTVDDLAAVAASAPWTRTASVALGLLERVA
jgi:glycosyltransferase A (GT-A) superfamily protein (DUF2064 family)